METQNPICNCCGCYWIPTTNDIKPSGLVSKSCTRCKEYQKKKREKNKCEHNREKSRCKDCGGSSICEHNRRKSQCKDCGGSSICEHNRRIYQCKDCGGSSICEHNRIKSTCRECNLQQYLLKIQRCSIRRLFGKSALEKDRTSIEYLGISNQAFIDFFKRKMDLYNSTNDNKMNWNNIQIDHIKPVSIFDLDDAEEFLKCSNYTNLQPLLSSDNLEKRNKWNNECEIYWNENIKDNETYFDIYNPFKI